jgi:putative DNA primase/helicase
MEMNDTGLGKQILNRYGQYIKYVSEHSDWMIWDVQDAVWLKSSDATKKLGHWQEEIVEGLVIDTESLSSNDEKQADYQNSWLRNQLNQNKISSVRQFLSERTAVSITQLNQNRRVVGVQNGVIELGSTGVILFRDQSPDDLITKSMNVTYDVSATCPIFEKFLNTVMQGDVDMINYFQVWLGYCLTGEINESIINFLYGSGKNGKSVFTDTIISLFGDYAIKINSETFMKNKMGVTNSAAMSDLAQMHGARLVISDEVPTDASFNTKVIKSIVGESTVTAKFLYQNTFNYQSTAKILLYGNDKVYGDHADDGFWRRMKLIEFGYIVPDEEVNKNLLSDLKNEFSGILNWALVGYTAWALNPDGLVIPDVIEKASEDYRYELDSIAQYLDYKIESNGLIFDNNDGSCVVQADMIANYKDFCVEQSLIITTNPKKFKKSVERYFKNDSRVTVCRVARGVAYSGILKNKGYNPTQGVDIKALLAS